MIARETSMAELATTPELFTLADLLALDVADPRRRALGHHLMTGHRVSAYVERDLAQCLDCTGLSASEPDPGAPQ